MKHFIKDIFFAPPALARENMLFFSAVPLLYYVSEWYVVYLSRKADDYYLYKLQREQQNVFVHLENMYAAP